MVTTSNGTPTCFEMPNAADASSVGPKMSGKRKPLVYRSTPDIAAAASLAELKSRRPAASGGDVDARAARTSTKYSSRQQTAAANRSGNRQTENSKARSVTSSSKTPALWRPTTPTTSSSPARTAASSKQSPAAASTLAASKKRFHSTGNLTTMTSPPPRRRMSANSATIKSSPMSVARNQPTSTDSKPVVISGRAQPRDCGAGKNASMRSRIGIAPGLLLPNCYQPSKPNPGIPARSVSLDASMIAFSPEITPTLAAETPLPPSPSIQRSLSVRERRNSSPLQAKLALDSYPEPPPEDKELNSRMEMLFEEYRKVERGLIFTDAQSPPCQKNCAANNNSTASQIPVPAKSPKSTAARMTTGSVGKSIGSSRTKSVGDLFTTPPSTPRAPEQQQQRSNRALHATSSSPGTSVRDTAAAGSRTSTARQKGQSSPRPGRPSAATPPPSRRTAVPSRPTAVSSPRQQSGKVGASLATADVAGSGQAGPRQMMGGVTRERRDSLPTSLSRRLCEFSVAAAADEDSLGSVDESAKLQRRLSTPRCSETAAYQRSVPPRAAEQNRMNDRSVVGIPRNVVAEPLCTTVMSSPRQRGGTVAAVTVSDVTSNTRRASVEPAQTSTFSVDQTTSAAAAAPPQHGDHTPRTERRSRSLIPRPVSCSGRASRRREDRISLTTTNPEPALRRFDSGVDVAAAGLSPSDDGVGAGSIEAVVERLSATIESCILADDNYKSSPAWQNESSLWNTVDSADEYY